MEAIPETFGNGSTLWKRVKVPSFFLRIQGPFRKAPRTRWTIVSGVYTERIGSDGWGKLASVRRSISRAVGIVLVSGSSFVVGIDAGSSNTMLRGESTARSAPVDLRGPAANPKRAGVKEAARTLADLVQEAIRSREMVHRIAVCIGVAGADQDEEQEALADRLRGALCRTASNVQVQVVHDSVIALDAAFGSGSGLIVITGTGSVAVARTEEGKRKRVGGWGYLLGDPGSGYAVGRAGLRAVAAAFDGGEETALQARLHEQHGIDDRERLLRRVYQEEFGIQDVAPLVIDAAAEGDSVASRILADQAGELAHQVEWLAGRCRRLRTRIALLGGMIQDEHYAYVLRDALRDRLPAWTVEFVREPPVVGALRRARRLEASV